METAEECWPLSSSARRTTVGQKKRMLVQIQQAQCKLNHLEANTLPPSL